MVKKQEPEKALKRCWSKRQNKGILSKFHHLSVTMGRCMRQYDKDHMKMAILKQEETFREQVHELHRLYRIQKVLMNDVKEELKGQTKSGNTRTRIGRWNSEKETDDACQPCYNHQDQRSPQKILDLELPAEEYIEKDDEEGELELTLAIGSNGRRKKDNSFTSDLGTGFSTSSVDDGNECRIFQVKEINLDVLRWEAKSKFNVEERTIEKSVNRPPWLLQCLSLNMA